MSEKNKKGTSDDKNWKIRFKGMSKDELKRSIKGNCQYALSKDQYSATLNDNFLALAITVRDRLIERWIETQQRYHHQNLKRVYYLSLEFLIGRLMSSNIHNLGLEKEVKAAIKDLGYNYEEICNQEHDAGLGNGGLGRLAACFLDSMATLGIPAHGYGIRYEYGIFNQKIKNGYQIEQPDEWLQSGAPWEFPRPEYAVPIKFYGKVNLFNDEKGKLFCKWTDTQDVLAVPYDIPVPGYKNDVVNTLRLWSARSTENFDFQYFNNGDYEQAVNRKIHSENISKVLYPNDGFFSGQELRLKQEYFLIAASIADMLRRFRSENTDLRHFPEKAVIQLNDTHPSLAIPELMRLLIDEHNMGWEDAWSIVCRSFAYTNHTLMPEALESWPASLLENLLPRHMQIIYEINWRFLEDVLEKYPKDFDRLARMSIIEESDTKRVRMAFLSVVASFSVNGVSALHTELLKKKVLKDFYEFFPEKFNNKTNGITQRRWLLKANPGLSQLVTKAIGDRWIYDLDRLKKLLPLTRDAGFIKQWQHIKYTNKLQLAEAIEKAQGIKIDPHSLFDVQVKRIHEYKRQLLFALYIIGQYVILKNDPSKFTQPRTFLVGGKAAPGYHMAKMIIKLINNVARVINHDKSVNDRIRLVFLENYRVSLAESIIPASDLSEQISLAGTEASGTGNMKFMLNGALTIGTLDGANIEIMEKAGKDNIFIFGLKTDDVAALRARSYNPSDYIQRSPLLNEVITLIRGNQFSLNEQGVFDPICESLLHADPFMNCADFDSYCQAQHEASCLYQDARTWTEKSIINVANAGYFSSDRTIREYAEDIWRLEKICNSRPKQV